MATEKARFTKEKVTMLMTLYGRALQSRWARPILPDPWAEEAVRRIDYDFSTLYGFGGLSGRLFSGAGCTIIATRASTFDLLTTRYLADHPDATVLHLGCGMDTRVFRVAPPAGVSWFDVDYPDVVEIRRRLFPDRVGYDLIGTSLADLRWLDDVPSDRPTLVVAEGVLMYLTEERVRALLVALTARFPSGEIVFDAIHPRVLKKDVAGTGASQEWGLDDARDVTRLAPKLELVKELGVPEWVAFSRFPLPVRVMYRAMDHVPLLRRMERVLVYRF